jgi:DNA invertase Pin-like site-specific DNA recombinase
VDGGRHLQGRGCFFRCIFSGGRPDTWADTTTPHGRLMLTVLGGLAEFERELIRARTGEELSLLARETPETQSE